jgi:hypothetical protein
MGRQITTVCFFRNTHEERFVPDLSLPSETSRVLAHKNNMPITIVGIPPLLQCHL